MAQPYSTDAIYKGGVDVSIVGGSDFNADGAAHLQDGAAHIQDGGEPDAPADPYRRQMKHEQKYALLQVLLKRSIWDRVGWGTL